MAATLIIGDKTFNIEVAEIQFNTEDEYRDSAYSFAQSPRTAMQSVELTGKIVSVGTTADLLDVFSAVKKEQEVCRDETCCEQETLKEEIDMGYMDEKCADTSLTDRIIHAEQSDEKKLLIKHGVVRRDGTLTESGKDLLLNILLKENIDDIVEKLELLDSES